MFSSSKNERVRVSKTSTLLCTCRAPDHMQTPQSWTSRLLISALHTVFVGEKGRESRKSQKREEKEEDKTEDGNNKKERERARKRKKRIERKRERKHPHTTQHHQHATHQTTQHPLAPTQHTTHHSTSDNRPWSWEFVNARICAHQSTDRDHEGVSTWMLGYAHSGQPTVISRVSARWKKWMLGYVHAIQPTVILSSVFVKRKVNAWIRAKCLFYLKR